MLWALGVEKQSRCPYLPKTRWKRPIYKVDFMGRGEGSAA